MGAFGRGHHTFLSRERIAVLKAYVPSTISGIPTLVVAYDEADTPMELMGIDVTKLEMLFLDLARIGTGTVSYTHLDVYKRQDQASELKPFYYRKYFLLDPNHFDVF